MDFHHHLSRFSKRLKMVSVSRDSMASRNLVNPKKIKGPNLPKSKQNLPEPSEMPPAKMKRLMQLFKRVMEFSRYHVDMERPPYPWQ
jgi:hypothetical protein